MKTSSLITRIFGMVFVCLTLVMTARAELRLTPVAAIGGVDIANANDGSNRMFFVNRAGRIFIIKNGQVLEQPFLDIRDRVTTDALERGLISMVFPPGFGPKKHFYVYYTSAGDRSMISRFSVSANPDIAIANSEEVILSQLQPFDNHNGGRLQFGPDGMLYFGFGDGGGGGDPLNNAQAVSTLLGKIIRIDVESGEQPYGIPPDNPFVNDLGIRDEIWALGVRNPYRIAFDQLTGDLYIADVGQNSREEVNFQPAGFAGGANYGWNNAEGSLCFVGDCSALTPPAFEYAHNQGCSITGGEVYRGQAYPAFDGVYFFADFCAGTVWGIRSQSGQFSVVESIATEESITTFGRDEVGNVYVASMTRTFLLSDGAVADSEFPLSGRLSGSWVTPGYNNQGLFINVGAVDSGQPFLAVAWFVFLNGDPFWITGTEFFEYGDTSITLMMRRAEGLEFLTESSAAATQIQIGTLNVQARSCELIEVAYDFPEFDSGTLMMDHLGDILGAECD